MIIPTAASIDHPMGDSRCIDLPVPVNDITKLIYVQIPKNASCWMKHHFMPAGSYNYYNDGFNIEKHLALVVLRDPIARWISGMGQFLVGHMPSSRYYVDHLDWNEVTTQVVFDDHTQPQVDFIANLPHNKITWFRCDDKLPINFVSYMKKYNIEINVLDNKDDVNNIFNVTKKVQSRDILQNIRLPESLQFTYRAPAQQTVVDKIINKLNENPVYLQRLKEFYHNDYNLYNTVPYYNAE